MYTVIQTERGASDRDRRARRVRHLRPGRRFVRYELDGEDALIEACSGADALICAYAPLTARVLDALPRVRHVAFMATGFNSVDMDAATERGIVVTNVPDYCTQEVADHTMGFLLALGRNLLRHHGCILDGRLGLRGLRQAGPHQPPDPGHHRPGAHRRAVALRAAAFGLTVLASDPFVGEGEGRFRRPQDQSRRGARCDYVSLHCVLSDETRRIVEAAALAAMKPSAFLVDAARGTPSTPTPSPRPS